MENNPALTVLICTYNRADLLPKAIDSVLQQSYQDFELLIIDDASKDDTAQVVSRYSERDGRIRYFLNEVNLGISGSRNRGIALARGKYVAVLDSDDYWIGHDKLRRQMETLEMDPEIGVIGTGILCINEKGSVLRKDIYESDDTAIRSKMLSKNQFAQSAVIFLKKAVLDAGGYDAQYIIAPDYDLWMRIGQSYRFANLKEPLLAYLIHSGGISKQKRRETVVETDKLVEKYKKNYPNYFRAKFKSYLRFLMLYVNL